MNYKDPTNKSDFINYKKLTINKLSTHIDELIDNEYKQSVNLTTWINYYCNSLKREKNFKPKYLPTYTRGSVVFVNFGYRLGSEHGGKHYAIVLDKSDNKSNPVLTVMPMSSLKPKTYLHPKFNISLGDEFYNLVLTKIRSALNEIENTHINLLSSKISTIEEKEALNQKENKLKKELLEVGKDIEKATKLKLQSYALLNQITTISKMRIIEPTKISDTIYNITFSTSTMDKISEKLSDLYL